MPFPTPTLSPSLEVGALDNLIAFEITATDVQDALWVSITIPCGAKTEDQVFLCADGEKATLNWSSNPANKVELTLSEQKKEKLRWVSSAPFSLKGEDNKVKITISGFKPEDGGTARVSLKVWKNPKKPLYEEVHEVSIKKAPGVAVIYFDVSPASLLKGGKVNITSYTTGAKTVTVRDDSGIIKPPVTVVPDKSGTKRTYSDVPQQGTTYHLEAWQDTTSEDKAGAIRDHRLVERQVFVAVEERSEWSSRDLLINSLGADGATERYYPTLLLAAPKLLYGIFVFGSGKTKRAELWSSSSGLDGWRKVTDVPEYMADSPGVIDRDRLWLIGGSSADPKGPRSNRMWCYYENQDGHMVTKEWCETDKVEGGALKNKLFPARMGHACAVFGNQIWVLGGLSLDNKPMDDVWTCSIPEGDDFNVTWHKCATPLKSGRCMSAVAVTPTSNPTRLWIYGGATHPFNYLESRDELLWTQDGKNWGSFGLPPGKTGKPLGVTLLFGSDGCLHLAGGFLNEKGGLVYSDHELGDMNLRHPTWRSSELGKIKWRFPRTVLFLIRSVCFGERWFFWPVYRYVEEMGNHDTWIYTAEASSNVPNK
ncbi:MAG: kelch repeat-containing protein [Candidatus Korobacteraceae bacterium]